jgi:polyisoprenoid-binding protein YceI
MKKLVSGIFTVFLLVSAAAASEWNIDPLHTNAFFSIRHLTIADVRGMFPDVSGTVKIDDDNIENSQVSVVIGTSTVDTGVEQRDNHLRSADFFETAEYPEMTFVSKKVVRKGKGRLSVTGDLTIRGTSKEAVLDVLGPTETIKDPWGFNRKGLKASTVINRSDFGITWNDTLSNGSFAVGNEVNITIDLEMTEKK